MSDPLLVALKSHTSRQVRDALQKYLPQEHHLIFVANEYIKHLETFIDYRIDTDYDLLGSCINHLDLYDNNITRINGHKFYPSMIHDCINKLISQGFKTERPMKLCEIGIIHRSISIIEHQFNDLTDDQKSELLKLAVDKKYVAGVKFIINQGVRYMGDIQENCLPVIKMMIESGR